jgi:hypothetical protein
MERLAVEVVRTTWFSTPKTPGRSRHESGLVALVLPARVTGQGHHPVVTVVLMVLGTWVSSIKAGSTTRRL